MVAGAVGSDVLGGGEAIGLLRGLIPCARGPPGSEIGLKENVLGGNFLRLHRRVDGGRRSVVAGDRVDTPAAEYLLDGLPHGGVVFRPFASVVQPNDLHARIWQIDEQWIESEPSHDVDEHLLSAGPETEMKSGYLRQSALVAHGSGVLGAVE